jgi:hypothetical protein
MSYDWRMMTECISEIVPIGLQLKNCRAEMLLDGYGGNGSRSLIFLILIFSHFIWYSFSVCVWGVSYLLSLSESPCILLVVKPLDIEHVTFYMYYF